MLSVLNFKIFDVIKDISLALPIPVGPLIIHEELFDELLKESIKLLI